VLKTSKFVLAPEAVDDPVPPSVNPIVSEEVNSARPVGSDPVYVAFNGDLSAINYTSFNVVLLVPPDVVKGIYRFELILDTVPVTFASIVLLVPLDVVKSIDVAVITPGTAKTEPLLCLEYNL
jgi:hypothetical protein